MGARADMLSAKLKKAEGKIQELTGDHLGGQIKQAQADADEKIAELRIQHNKKRSDIKEDLEDEKEDIMEEIDRRDRNY